MKTRDRRSNEGSKDGEDWEKLDVDSEDAMLQLTGGFELEQEY